MRETRHRRESDLHDIVKHYPLLLDQELKGITPRWENPYLNLLRPDFKFYYFRCELGEHSISEDEHLDNVSKKNVCPIHNVDMRRIAKIVEIKSERLKESDLTGQLLPYLEEEEKEGKPSRKIEGILLGYPPRKHKEKAINSIINTSKYDISLKLVGRDFPKNFDQIIFCSECRQPYMRIGYGSFRCPTDGCREFLRARTPKRMAFHDE